MAAIFPELSPIGYVQKTLGFQGEMQLTLIVNTVPNVTKPKFLWFMQYGKPVPFLVLKFEVQGHDKVHLILEDINDEQAVVQLKGLSCLIEDDVYDDYFVPIESYEYLFDFQVYDANHGFLGVVTDVMVNDNGHDNLVVVKEATEIMIPFVDHIILSIDEEQREIQVDLPEGLLELFAQGKG